jgi:hypothetical protein
MLILTSACCWLLYVKNILLLYLIYFYCFFSWFAFYVHQWKPLFGPQLKNDSARILRSLWGQDF